jgi:hypothetical protein
MRITRIELFRAPMVMRESSNVAIGLTEISQSLFMRVVTDTGISLSAAVHLISARDNLVFADLDSAELTFA